MPSYIYLCPIHNEFEVEHSITTQLEKCPLCEEEGKASDPPKRLISGGTGFLLSGGGWASSGYSGK